MTKQEILVSITRQAILKQVQGYLEESSRHMEQALTHSRVVITCQDLELRYVWVFNPQAGYENTVGKKLEEFGNKSQVEAILPLKQEVLRTRQPVQKIVTMDFGGRGRTFDMTVTPNFDGDSMIGLTTVSVDLTDLLAAQEELHQAHARLLGMLGDKMVGGKVGRAMTRR